MINIKQKVAITGNVAIGRTIPITGNVSSNTIARLNTDYNELDNKPSINSVTLIGNKVSEELGLEPTIVDITEQDIDRLIYGG